MMDAQRMRLRERMQRDAREADKRSNGRREMAARNEVRVHEYASTNPTATLREAGLALGLAKETVRRHWPRPPRNEK